MKRILFASFILLFSLFLLTPALAKETSSQKEKILKSNEVVEKDYFAAGDYVALHGTVNGDAYLVGGNILVDGTVNGDIIAFGGQIIIEANKVNNIRAAGGSITINSKEILGNVTLGGGQVDIADTAFISGSLVSGAGNLRIAGPIGKGAHLGAGQISILNDINGDVFIGGEVIRFAPNAKINGNLTYWNKNKIALGQNQVTGTVTQKIPPDVERARNQSMTLISSAKAVKTIIDLVTTIIFGIIFIYVLPVFTTRVKKLVRSSFLKSLGIGFLATILTPILFVILLITVVGIPFSFLLLFIYIIMAYFAKIFVSIVIGEKIFEILGSKNTGLGWVFIVGLIVYYLLSFIPVFGPIFVFVVLLLGIGALIITKKDYFLLFREKKII